MFVVLLMTLHPTQQLEPPANPGRFIAYGSSLPSVKGGLGIDKFYTRNYDSNLDGGGGSSDTVFLQGAASQWKYEGTDFLAPVSSTTAGALSVSDITLINTVSNIKLTLKNIEKY